MTTADDKFAAVHRRYSELDSRRVNWLTHWQDIGDYVLPFQADFNIQRTEGEPRTQRLYDTTAPLALSKAASYMDALLTPSSRTWHRLTSTNADVNKLPEVKMYYDEVTERLFKYRYVSQANFANQMRENYQGLLGFGTGVMYVDENPGKHLTYKSLHLSKTMIAESAEGVVDTVVYKFSLTARQAKQKFNRPDDNLPDIITNEKVNPDKVFNFYHMVQPVTDDQYTHKARGFEFASCMVCIEGKTIVREGGFRTFPYCVGRMQTSPNETYGRSPTMIVLPDIKMVNQMKKTHIRSLHRRNEPPILAFSDGIANRFSVKPNHINYGALSKEGVPLMRPFETGAQPNAIKDELEMIHQHINDAYFITLFQVMVDNPNMTATEVLQREQEKADLLSSQLDKIQSEQLSKIVEREFDILSRNGLMPPMPKVLVEAAGEYQLEYQNPFTQLQKQQEIKVVNETFAIAAGFAQIDPSVMDNFDFDALTRGVAEIKGFKEKWFKDPKVVQQTREARDQQQQMLTAAQGAPQVASAVRDLAQASQLSAQVA
jgi:hypothetical protein